MKIVILQKYIESMDDTEFSIFVLDDQRDVNVFVQYLCDKDKSYNQKIAVNCSDEKFEKIIGMKKDRQVELVLLENVDTQEEVDRIINNAYSDLRVEKGLESGWFNGHSI